MNESVGDGGGAAQQSPMTATEPKMAPQPVGSNPLLDSTANPGPNFGRFNLPMSTLELVWQVSNGTPCEIPRSFLGAALRAIEECFRNADVEVKADTKIAQFTPRRMDLSEYGRRVLSNVRSDPQHEDA